MLSFHFPETESLGYDNTVNRAKNEIVAVDICRMFFHGSLRLCLSAGTSFDRDKGSRSGNAVTRYGSGTISRHAVGL